MPADSKSRACCIFISNYCWLLKYNSVESPVVVPSAVTAVQTGKHHPPSPATTPRGDSETLLPLCSCMLLLYREIYSVAV